MATEQFELGEYFTVPLRGHGYAHGYFTSVDYHLMKVVAIHDRLTEAPDLPDDIEDVPLILPNLRIGGGEFSIPAKMEPFQGKRWMRRKKVRTAPVELYERLYIISSSFNPRVIDLTTMAELRPATPEDCARYEALGFGLVPAPTHEIEIALRRLDLKPWEFEPESVRQA